MLSKHAFAYLLSHGVPALISFVSIALFTRLLSTEEYGTYVVVFAVAAMINAVVFEWLKQSLLRFYPKYQDQTSLFETIKLSFLGLALTTLIVGVIANWLLDGFTLLHLLLCLLLSWAQSWNGINLTLMRAKLNPRTYGYLSFSRTTLTLVLSTALIYAGLAEVGLLLGWILAFGITLALRLGVSGDLS